MYSLYSDVSVLPVYLKVIKFLSHHSFNIRSKCIVIGHLAISYVIICKR